VITKTATYKLLADILCSLVFGYLTLRMLYAYIRLRLDDSIGTVNEKEFVLGKILEDEVHTAFINDKRLFWGVSNEYLKDYYKYLLRLMNDEFMDYSTKLIIVMAVFPLVFNTAWWTNCITASATFLNKLVSDGKLGPSFLMILKINVGCGGFILSIHVCK